LGNSFPRSISFVSITGFFGNIDSGIGSGSTYRKSQSKSYGPTIGAIKGFHLFRDLCQLLREVGQDTLSLQIKVFTGFGLIRKQNLKLLDLLNMDSFVMIVVPVQIDFSIQ